MRPDSRCLKDEVAIIIILFLRLTTMICLVTPVVGVQQGFVIQTLLLLSPRVGEGRTNWPLQTMTYGFWTDGDVCAAHLGVCPPCILLPLKNMRSPGFFTSVISNLSHKLARSVSLF